MSIQVSSNPKDSALSTAAQGREAFLTRLLDLAKQSASGLDTFNDLRDHAAVRVQEQAFPTTRDEEWRFTDLSPLMQLELTGDRPSSIATDAIAPFLLSDAANRLVFVNGVYDASLSQVESLPENVILGNLSSLPSAILARLQAYVGRQSGAQELFTALNTVGLTDAAVVFVPKNTVVDVPIHLLFISTSGSTVSFIQPRCLIVAEPNSAITILEDHVTVGEGAYFTNTVTEIWLDDNAQVNHSRIQRDNQAAVHIGKTAVSQARSSRYTCNAISFGGALSRHNLEVYQTGEQTETHLNGLTRIGGEQVADTHSAIALTKPYGMTRQLHKCIIDDKAHAIFNGKVFVPKAAQLTDAGQLNRNLLLSPKARVDTKPQLEIVADNVKCTHGATVGQLDTDEVFYLQSRGIDTASARNLLIYAFAFEIIDAIPVASLRQVLLDQVRQTNR
ncbi:MAG TPA: Fe-S cluster assembly protein SufD [Crinalium sp.]|jgi:Fe-S cluster assembly protein SufD